MHSSSTTSHDDVVGVVRTLTDLVKSCTAMLDACQDAYPNISISPDDMASVTFLSINLSQRIDNIAKEVRNHA